MGIRDGLRVETRLDPKAQPFLDHHRIDGTPVLPGVMGIEAFAELARLLLPGWSVSALEDVRFEAPFKFYRGEPRIVDLVAQLRPEGDEVVADCRLVGRRELPGLSGPQATTHFTARVRLAAAPLAEERRALPGAPAGVGVGPGDVYRVYFHGPAYRVLERVWRAGNEVAGRLADGLPTGHVPAEFPLQAGPRLVELCFQTAGVHEIGATGRMGLPRRIARLDLPGGAPAEVGGSCALVAPRPTGGYDAVVLDPTGRVVVRLSGYETAALPELVSEDLREPLRRAVGAT
jgi:hypothetical protein